jgi:hypothetical protein
MNIIFSLFISLCFILLGVNRILGVKRNTKALYEALQFINLVKNNIRFSSMDYENLIENAKKEQFSFISFEEGVRFSGCASENPQKEFSCFLEKIGTTDILGQMSICDEYIERFKGFYNESVKNEKGKVNVIGALSVLSVVCVLILGG